MCSLTTSSEIYFKTAAFSYTVLLNALNEPNIYLKLFLKESVVLQGWKKGC